MIGPSQVLAGWRCRWASSPGDPPRVLVARSPEGREVSIGEVSPTWGGQRWLATLLHPRRRKMRLLGHGERGEEGAALDAVEFWARSNGATVEPRKYEGQRGPVGARARLLEALDRLGEATARELADATGAHVADTSTRLQMLAAEHLVERAGARKDPHRRGRAPALWRRR